MILNILNEFYKDHNRFLEFKFEKEYLPNISINHYVSNLIYFLIKINNFSKCLDIGTLNGKSAMVMARSVLDVIAESDKEKKIITIEKNHDHFLNAKKNFELNQLDHLIDAYCGDAKNVLENLKGQICFDLIFIDADKASSEFYLDFARNHLSENGLIIIDNIFLHLKNNEKFSKNSKIYQSLELTIEKIKNEYDSIVIPYKRDDSEDALCLAKLRK